jgi:hypothetical protein
MPSHMMADDGSLAKQRRPLQIGGRRARGDGRCRCGRGEGVANEWPAVRILLHQKERLPGALKKGKRVNGGGFADNWEDKQDEDRQNRHQPGYKAARRRAQSSSCIRAPAIF